MSWNSKIHRAGKATAGITIIVGILISVSGGSIIVMQWVADGLTPIDAVLVGLGFVLLGEILIMLFAAKSSKGNTLADVLYGMVFGDE